jgi:hypothetical protein
MGSKRRKTATGHADTALASAATTGSTAPILPPDVIADICQRLGGVAAVKALRLAAPWLRDAAALAIKTLIARKGRLDKRAWYLFAHATGLVVHLDPADPTKAVKRLVRVIRSISVRLLKLDICPTLYGYPKDALFDEACFCILYQQFARGLRHITINPSISPGAATLLLAGLPSLEHASLDIRAPQPADALMDDSDGDSSVDGQYGARTDSAPYLSFEAISAALQHLHLTLSHLAFNAASLSDCKQLKHLSISVDGTAYVDNADKLSACTALEVVGADGTNELCWALPELPALRKFQGGGVTVRAGTSCGWWEQIAGSAGLQELELYEMVVDVFIGRKALYRLPSKAAAAPTAAAVKQLKLELMRLHEEDDEEEEEEQEEQVIQGRLAALLPALEQLHVREAEYVDCLLPLLHGHQALQVSARQDLHAAAAMVPVRRATCWPETHLGRVTCLHVLP